MSNSNNMYSRYVFECECNEEIPIDRRRVKRDGNTGVDTSSTNNRMHSRVSSGAKHTEGRR